MDKVESKEGKNTHTHTHTHTPAPPFAARVVPRQSERQNRTPERTPDRPTTKASATQSQQSCAMHGATSGIGFSLKFMDFDYEEFLQRKFRYFLFEICGF